MAKPTKLRNCYYVRMAVTDIDGSTKYKWINLGTDNLATAQERMIEVLNFSELIKSGKSIDFWWKTGNKNAVNTLLLEEAIESYIEWSMRLNNKPSTIEVYRTALAHLQNVLGKNYHIEKISRKDLERFRHYFSADLSLHTVKKNERAVHTFMVWLKDEDIISNIPKLRPLRIPRQQPVYISENELKLIQAKATSFMAKVYTMYAETGMRLSEAFLGEIKGTFLIIQGDEGKNGMIREIPLRPSHIEIIKEMRELGWTPKHYSRSFWAACKDAKVTGKKFHSLRHTFGITSWLKHRDIFLTMKMMGHTNISTTQIYTQFHLRRLQEDFPSLAMETERIIPFHESIHGA
jgi:integrase